MINLLRLSKLGFIIIDLLKRVTLIKIGQLIDLLPFEDTVRVDGVGSGVGKLIVLVR